MSAYDDEFEFGGYAGADYNPWASVDFDFDESGEIAGYEVDEERLGDNLVKVEVYYDSLNVKLFEETQTLSLVQLISGIAGLLGLFLGFSVMTFAEYMELLAVTPLARKKRRNNRVAVAVAPPTAKKISHTILEG